jgi:hypothetical protein
MTLREQVEQSLRKRGVMPALKSKFASIFSAPSLSDQVRKRQEATRRSIGAAKLHQRLHAHFMKKASAMRKKMLKMSKTPGIGL